MNPREKDTDLPAFRLAMEKAQQADALDRLEITEVMVDAAINTERKASVQPHAPEATMRLILAAAIGARIKELRGVK